MTLLRKSFSFVKGSRHTLLCSHFRFRHNLQECIKNKFVLIVLAYTSLSKSLYARWNRYLYCFLCGHYLEVGKLILVKRRTLDIWVYYVNYRCCLLLCCMEERVDASIYNRRVYSSFYTILQLFEGLNWVRFVILLKVYQH